MSRNYKGRPGFFTSYVPTLSADLAEEYRKFNQGLSPQQRAALGIKNPEDNPTGEIRPICRDAEEFPVEADNLDRPNLLTEAFIHNDPNPADPSAGNPNPNKLDLIVVLEVIRRLLSIYEVAVDLKTRLHGEVIALALGVPGTKSVSDLARKYGCSRQAVSCRLVRVIEALDLPPTWRMITAANAQRLKDLDNLTKTSRKKASKSPGK